MPESLSEQVAALETAVAVRDRMMDDMANANLRLKQQLAAAESRVEAAKREAFVDGAAWMGFHYESDKRLAAAEADRRYPAPSPVGGERTEQRCPTCGCNGQSVRSHHHSAPTPPAAPEPVTPPIVLLVDLVRGECRIDARLARRIVALGSRPTQTAEG